MGIDRCLALLRWNYGCSGLGPLEAAAAGGFRGESEAQTGDQLSSLASDRPAPRISPK